MNRELRSCPNCDATEYSNIITVTPSQFVPLNHSYCEDTLEVLGVDPHEPFPIVRCRSCGFQYSLFILASDILQKLYNQCIDPVTSQAKIYKVYKRSNYNQLWNTLFYLWSQGRNDETIHVRLLDYGCGWGDFMMTAHVPGVTCIGLEYDRRKRAYVKALGFEVVDSHDDLAGLAPFDLFFCNQVLEHVAQPRMVMRTLNNCTSMGAYGFIGVPDFSAENFKPVTDGFRTGSLMNKNVNPWEHLNYFTHGSLAQMLYDAGFRVIQSQRCGALKHFFITARRYMGLHQYRVREWLSGVFGKAEHQSYQCVHNRTTFFVQKFRKL